MTKFIDSFDFEIEELTKYIDFEDLEIISKDLTPGEIKEREAIDNKYKELLEKLKTIYKLGQVLTFLPVCFYYLVYFVY